MSRRLSFVVPVKNDAARLERCLARIVASRREQADIEMIVADNGSSDGSPDIARGMGARVLSLPTLRVAELRNRAAAETTGEFVAFVDADHEIDPGWTVAALEVLSDESVGGAGALYASPNSSWVQAMYGVLRGRTVGRGDTLWLGSGNLVVRRSAFTSVGGFDPALEACEDVDLCQRLTAAGWRLVADERLRSVHLGDPATLKALFRAERWRGRDNIRVSLRGRLSARELPSLLIPIVQVAALATLTLGVLAIPIVGPDALIVALVCALLVAALSGLRALRMVIGGRLFNPVAMVQAFIVAATYDMARAIALVGRAPHHRRHERAQAAA